MPSQRSEQNRLAMDRRGPYDGCWEWTGSHQAKGYGYLFSRGEESLVHRRAWEAVNGPIPDGLCVLHRCDNPPCWRPDHLFLGTKADNNRDMTEKGRHWHLTKKACKKGHPWTPENTVLATRKNGRAHRVCRQCERERSIRGVKARNQGRGDLLCPAGFQRHRFLGGDVCIKCGGSREERRGTQPWRYKTHCAKGHPLSGDNLYVKPNGARRCRACRTAEERERTRRKKERVAA